MAEQVDDNDDSVMEVDLSENTANQVFRKINKF